MTTSAVGSTASSAGSTASGMAKAFRQADFLKIMLTEITNQNPMDPTDTSKMVDGMQKLQELANTTYQKYRSDITWAQNLVGKSVNVQQSSLTEAEKKALVDKGVNVDVGYGSVDGTVTSFRMVEETVYVTVQPADPTATAKEYPIDNVKQITPDARDPSVLANVAGNLLGRKADYWGASATDRASGTVSDVSWGSDGEILLTIGGKQVPYSHLVGISSAQ